MQSSTLTYWNTFLRRHGVVLALGLLVLGVGISYTDKALEGRSAIVRFLGQLKLLDEGVDIYAKYKYPHPPVMAWGLKQLLVFPPVVAALTWFALKVGMTILAMLWIFKLCEQHGSPFPGWAKVLAVGLSLRPLIGDLSHGNINLFILFLIVASLYAWRQKRDLVAGLVLGLAIVCRLTPALFLVYFIWKRSWTTVAATALGMILFVWVVPGALFGPERNAQLLGSWADRWIKPFVVKGLVEDKMASGVDEQTGEIEDPETGQGVLSEHHNQSLAGVLFRLTTESPSFSTYIKQEYTPLEFHNILTLPPKWAGWMVKGMILLYLGLVAWSCRTPSGPSQRQNWRLAAEFSVIALGILLLNERTWKHHCVTLVLPFSVLAYCLSTCRLRPWLKWYTIGSLVAVVLLMSSTSTGLLPKALFGRAAKLAQVYGAYAWANLVLLASLVVLLRQDETSMPAVGARPEESRVPDTQPGEREAA